MSTLIYGKIVSNNIDKLLQDKNFNFDVVKICANESFGFVFKLKPNDFSYIPFIISENFLFDNCDDFMDEIYYQKNGISTLEKTKNDISKIKKVFEYILSYSEVEKIILFLSFGEVGSIHEFKKIKLNIDEFNDILLNEYLATNGIPTLMMEITK